MERYFADLFDADDKFWVFDRDQDGAEVEGPFDSWADAQNVADGLERDEQAGHSDPRPDPVAHPTYWNE
jgi:hypothetical protein